MDYRFLVQENLYNWDMNEGYGPCSFCREFKDCKGCPMFFSDEKWCTTMVIDGMTYSKNLGNAYYTRGCISFYKEWLETGVMPTVEYRRV